MKVAFNGFEEKLLTFLTDDSLEPGQLVAPASAGKVAAAQEDEEFMGVVTQVKDDCVVVLMRGFAEIDYSGTISAPGYYCLVADEDGIATPGDDGKVARLVTAVDSTNGKITVLF